ncbi:MAG: tetratricopeptide repeat protein [Bryobacteraceae bacterium]
MSPHIQKPPKAVYCWLRLIALLIVALSFCGAAQLRPGPSVDTEAALQAAYARLYDFDFKSAHEILDRQHQLDPQAPMVLAIKCAAYLFAELDRLKILELDFFTDDDKVVDRRKLIPDPAIRQKFFDMVAESDKLAYARLAVKPDDPDALMALCMTTGMVTDYAALVEKRRFGSFSLAKKSHAWAKKLLALNPPVVDAYMTFGTAEYIVGSLPFFLRWFVRMDSVEGSKSKGIEELTLVARKGKYDGPFARILLAVIALREKHPEEAERLLAGLAKDYPDNPLIRKELARVSRQIHPGGAVTR